ncbi:MAG: ABC transporter ATP-binding protein, partial [Desulfitobacterium hafniense]|nr:ABC transporter ATP-binding protein [Desulfitobacterium hafniense]
MSEERKADKSQGFGGKAGGPAGSLGKPVEKAKNFKGTLFRLLRYLKPQRTKFIAVFIFALLSTIFSIVGPKVMGKAITKIGEGFAGKMMALKMNQPVPPMDFTYIGQIVLILLGLYIISAAFSYLQQYIMAGVSQKTVYNMRKEVDEKLSRLPLKFFDARTHGEILSRVTNDFDNISTTLQQSLTQLITSIATIIGVVVMMLSISPILTLIVILTLPLYVVVTMNIAKHSQKQFAAQQKSLGELNGHVEEMYTGHRIVKA